MTAASISGQHQSASPRQDGNRPGPLVRFAHSPSGGGPTAAGDDTCPAWDFQMLLPGGGFGVKHQLDMRLVFKPWEGRADVLARAKEYLDSPR